MEVINVAFSAFNPEKVYDICIGGVQLDGCHGSSVYTALGIYLGGIHIHHFDIIAVIKMGRGGHNRVFLGEFIHNYCIVADGFVNKLMVVWVGSIFVFGGTQIGSQVHIICV